LGSFQQEPLAEKRGPGLRATGSAGTALLGSRSEAAVQTPLSHHYQCLAAASPLAVWQSSRWMMHVYRTRHMQTGKMIRSASKTLQRC